MKSIGIPIKTYFIGEGVKFERIRRITGYLVGTLNRFNDAKRAEEKDRVKHGMGGRV
jgi:ribonucleoside-triphosphate reductase